MASLGKGVQIRVAQTTISVCNQRQEAVPVVNLRNQRPRSGTVVSGSDSVGVRFSLGKFRGNRCGCSLSLSSVADHRR